MKSILWTVAIFALVKALCRLVLATQSDKGLAADMHRRCQLGPASFRRYLFVSILADAAFGAAIIALLRAN